MARMKFDDASMANVVLLGFACQHGALPLSPEAIEAAIRKLGLAVDRNLAAFRAGRARAEGAHGRQDMATSSVPTGLEDIIAHRRALLSAYQDSRYADRYETFVRAVAASEQVAVGDTKLAEIVATNLAKLMAYKDEYEVARLYTQSAFLRDLKRQYGENAKLRFHLAPPMMSGWKQGGAARKRAFGPWILTMFRLLSALRRFRGTPIDLFGHTDERRMERAAITEYQRIVAEMLPRLTSDTHTAICTVASYPEQIRGFGHVKQRSNILATAWRQARLDELAIVEQQSLAQSAA
jgi:indolepyruvate ferredoxin oxidoreductase